MNILEVIAECSIALTGFGAIIAALRGADSPRGVFRAWSVVSLAGLAFVLSLIPLGLSLTTLAADTLWTTASAMAFVAIAASTISTFYLDNRLRISGFPAQARISIRSAQTCTVIAILAMLLNALGWPRPAGPSLYALGVILVIVSALIALLHSFLLPLQLTLRETAIGAPDAEPRGGKARAELDNV